MLWNTGNLGLGNSQFGERGYVSRMERNIRKHCIGVVTVSIHFMCYCNRIPELGNLQQRHFPCSLFHPIMCLFTCICADMHS